MLLNKSYSFVILLGPEPRPPLDPRMDRFPRNLAYLMNMRQRGRGFEPHRRHCVVSLSNFLLLFFFFFFFFLGGGGGGGLGGANPYFYRNLYNLCMGKK